MRLRLLQGWARIVAHFVDAAEKANFTPDEINRRLRQLAETTVLDEFWITDEKGLAYLRNIDVDFTFSPSALEQPQAHVFWPLLLGKKDQVIQEAQYNPLRPDQAQSRPAPLSREGTNPQRGADGCVGTTKVRQELCHLRSLYECGTRLGVSRPK